MKTGLRISPLLLAVILMAVCLVPVMALKDISPSNELRYLSIADEALENGSVFTFSNHGEPYADKPPLYLWLVMLLRLVLGGHNTFVLSLLSFIPAMVTTAVMDRWLLLVSGHSSLRFSFGERFAAAMMTGTSVMFLGASVVLRMDMLMTMFIVLALFTFYKMYRNIGNRRAAGFLMPVWIFLALFTKGPVGLIMPVAGIVVFLLFSGKILDTGRYLGFRTWGILAVLCAIWFSGVWLEGGREYLDNLLFHQTVGRAVNAFHHKQPIWYYMVAIWYVAAPYSIAMVYALFSRAGRSYVTDAGRLFRVSAVSVFILLSLFSSKLAVYLLPVVPFLAYYTVMTGKQTGCNGWMRFSFAVPSAILLLAAAAVFCIPFVRHLPVSSLLPEDILGLASRAELYAAAVILAAGAFISFHALFRKRSWTASASSVGVSLMVAILALSPLVPRVNNYIGYRNLCSTAEELKEMSGVSGYAAFGISRAENMDVWLGQDVEDLGDDAADLHPWDISDTIFMTTSSAVRQNPYLRARLSGLRCSVCGPYMVYIIDGKPESRR